MQRSYTDEHSKELTTETKQKVLEHLLGENKLDENIEAIRELLTDQEQKELLDPVLTKQSFEKDMKGKGVYLPPKEFYEIGKVRRIIKEKLMEENPELFTPDQADQPRPTHTTTSVNTVEDNVVAKSPR